MGANWGLAKKPDSHEFLTKYKNETHHDTRRMTEILGSHHNETNSWNVPLDMRVSALKGVRRPDDGLPMDEGSLNWWGDGPSFAALADVDGDGVEFLEVVHAILMQPPGAESLLTDAPRGELLYPEVVPEDAEQSVLEVSLRNELKDLVQRFAKLHRRVLDHREELEGKCAEDTQQFIQREAASLAMQVAKLSVDASSKNKEDGLRLMQMHLVDLANSGASEPKCGQIVSGRIVPAGSHSKRTLDRHGGPSGSRGSNGVVCEAEILPRSSTGKSTVCCSLPLPKSEKLNVNVNCSTSCWANDGELECHHNENLATDQVIGKHRSNLAYAWWADPSKYGDKQHPVSASRSLSEEEDADFGGLLGGSVMSTIDRGEIQNKEMNFDMDDLYHASGHKQGNVANQKLSVLQRRMHEADSKPAVKSKELPSLAVAPVPDANTPPDVDHLALHFKSCPTSSDIFVYKTTTTLTDLGISNLSPP